MKVSKRGKKSNVFTTPVKNKRFLSLLTNKILVELEAYRKQDAAQIHSQGVKQIIAQKVVFF